MMSTALESALFWVAFLFLSSTIILGGLWWFVDRITRDDIDEWERRCKK